MSEAEPFLRGIPSPEQGESSDANTSPQYRAMVRARRILLEHTIPIEHTIESSHRVDRYWVPEQAYPSIQGFVALCGIQIWPKDEEDAAKMHHPSGIRPAAQYYELYVRNGDHVGLYHFRLQPASSHPMQRMDAEGIRDIDPVANPEDWQQMEDAFTALQDQLGV